MLGRLPPQERASSRVAVKRLAWSRRSLEEWARIRVIMLDDDVGDDREFSVERATEESRLPTDGKDKSAVIQVGMLRNTASSTMRSAFARPD